MILSEDISVWNFLSYPWLYTDAATIPARLRRQKYDNAFAGNKQRYEILIAHGGDEKHIPIQRK